MTSKNARATSAEAPATADELRMTIKDMQAVAQEVLEQMSAVARLALIAVEGRAADCSHSRDLHGALRYLAHAADGLDDMLHAEAERAGCGSPDDAATSAAPSEPATA